MLKRDLILGTGGHAAKRGTGADFHTASEQNPVKGVSARQFAYRAHSQANINPAKCPLCPIEIDKMDIEAGNQRSAAFGPRFSRFWGIFALKPSPPAGREGSEDLARTSSNQAKSLALVGLSLFLW
jgi:hypothetical protein